MHKCKKKYILGLGPEWGQDPGYGIGIYYIESLGGNCYGEKKYYLCKLKSIIVSSPNRQISVNSKQDWDFLTYRCYN